ncbi:MAG: hypothetical protein EAZ74_04525 [Alphaproteobacteria bacterium]|nr:MAG: hypothetical protein EAY76_06605 [Alphaproteobacteria bacterium]TAF14167.1 MAG: hypothetical protein EAZ74_04525 [Alphaproteobacteria bacterium]TAF39398.1 MAG: hypothetical protein EAZ66_04670 [Alphaproteobacteria bacterium]TAF74943.1 MAG: hypothetical protein EAZ52_07790 [Alphaproteobacteria bacterium]
MLLQLYSFAFSIRKIMNQQPPQNQSSYYGRDANSNTTINQLLNDPNVVFNPYAQYGVQMGWRQKMKLRREIRLQMRSKSWFQDKYQFVLVQRNILAIITLACALVSLATVWTVHGLTPLKSVEPFIIQIEERSGITQIVQPGDHRNISSKEAMDNYFLWFYVRGRETYHPSDTARRLEISRVMSSPDIFEEYRLENSPNNPESAVAMLGSAGTRVVSNPLINYIPDAKNPNNKIAHVQFVVTETFKKIQTRYPKTAIITYDYFDLKLSRSERLINPLGFQVLSYRTDKETVSK